MCKNEVVIVLQQWYMPKTYHPIFYLHLCHVKDYRTSDIWGFCHREFLYVGVSHCLSMFRQLQILMM
jgi:hypothetical protein